MLTETYCYVKFKYNFQENWKLGTGDNMPPYLCVFMWILF